MSYPRIYSLSTVGILKHYVHDYLFHPLRTDFIGPNGVGKSIIADLLQMIFIYDKDYIKFGTDGVKKEERQISSLPYKTNCAYCFLNIEVKKSKFITIGIQINSQKGKRIIPFLITKQADIDLNINELTLEKEDLIFAKDLLKEKETGKEILDIQDLAISLHQKQGLRLSFYSNSDSINVYYRFLYDKNILPLNLSQDKNLKAFAKVIQSFSKAKTLSLDGSQASKNLKEFLFEESDEDIFANFLKEKSELEKILREYESLNMDIQALTEKQKKLTALRDIEQLYRQTQKSYKQAELHNTFTDLNNLQISKTKGEGLLKQQQNELQKLEKIINRIPYTEGIITNSYKEADENFILLNKFEELTIHIKTLNENIYELEILTLPELDDSWKNEVQRVDVSNRTNEDIKGEITFAIPYLEKYYILENIIQSREKQSELLDDLKLSLKKEKESKQKLLLLLLSNDENSLLGWYIKNLPELDNNQLQSIFYFSTIPISEIPNPEKSSRYINPKEFIENFKATSSQEGLWLKLGALYEFIHFDKEADILGDKTHLKESIQKLSQKLRTELNFIINKEDALKNVTDAKPYDTTLFDDVFDISIIENGAIEKLKKAVAHILQIDEKISMLQLQKKLKEDELQTIKTQLKVKYDELEGVKKEVSRIKGIWLGRIRTISNYRGKKEIELNSLKKELDRTKEDLDKIIENVGNHLEKFKVLNQEYYQDFGENITDFNNERINIEEIALQFEQASEAYRESYKSITHLFNETSDGKNVPVQLSIKDKTFSFKTLEEALLGSKIKSTDDIATALHEANQTRTMIANGIKDNIIKVFGKTGDRYDKYNEQVKRINSFFVDRKISGNFYFKLEFNANKELRIEYINQLAYEIRSTALKGELQFEESIVDFIENFFKKQAKIKDKVPIDKLLNPKTYFELSAMLTDQFGTEVPGSTGETYSAIALLGIARLSAVQKEKRIGLRFIILEELGSLDNTNFNTFPAIAEEFQYQIITMAPHTFNIGLSTEWYAHHLIKGKEDDKINYHPSASYFKTKDSNEDLNIYINRM